MEKLMPVMETVEVLLMSSSYKIIELILKDYVSRIFLKSGKFDVVRREFQVAKFKSRNLHIKISFNRQN